MSADPLAGLSDDERDLVEEVTQLEWTSPMLLEVRDALAGRDAPDVIVDGEVAGFSDVVRERPISGEGAP